MRTSVVSRARQRSARTGECGRTLSVKGRCEVTDLLYAALLIAIFAVLALTLRGLEKL